MGSRQNYCKSGILPCGYNDLRVPRGHPRKCRVSSPLMRQVDFRQSASSRFAPATSENLPSDIMPLQGKPFSREGCRAGSLLRHPSCPESNIVLYRFDERLQLLFNGESQSLYNIISSPFDLLSPDCRLPQIRVVQLPQVGWYCERHSWKRGRVSGVAPVGYREAVCAPCVQK